MAVGLKDRVERNGQKNATACCAFPANAVGKKKVAIAKTSRVSGSSVATAAELQNVETITTQNQSKISHQSSYNFLLAYL